MVSQTNTWTPKKITLVLVIFFITCSSNFSQPIDTEIKCGSCPCGNPCSDEILTAPPPPPPPPPATPPPLPLPEYSSPLDCDLLPLPPPPPPPPSRPPPTPPPPRFVYVTSAPGEGYYNYYSASQNRVVGLLVLVGFGALSVTMIIFG